MNSLFTTPNLVTLLIIVVLFALEVYLWRRLRAKLQADPFADCNEAQISSTLGVLGTFFGITVGLLMFNPGDIEHLKDNLSGLLGGLQTAFITSVIGMTFSLYFQRMQRKAREEALAQPDRVDEDASIKDLIEYLQKDNNEHRETERTMLELMQNNNETLQQTISESIKQMTVSIVGDGEYTVIGQMKQMRLETLDAVRHIQQEVHDGNERTLEAFQHFAETLAENNTKTFIQALTDTMKDFNDKLTTQFGENFKQLNDAVGRMLEWQQHYKDLIEQMTEVQRETFKGIEEAKTSLGNMEQSASSMTESANKLADIVVTAAAYEKKLEETLREIEALSQNAQQVVPSILSMMDATNESTKTTTEQTMQSLQSTATAMQEEVTKSVTDMSAIIAQKMNDSVTQMNKLSQLHHDKATAITESAIKSLDETAKKMSDDVAQSTRDITKQMADDISKKLEETGRNLAEYAKNSDDSVSKLISDATEQFNTAYKEAFHSMESLSEALEKDIKAADKKHQKQLEQLSKQVEEAVHAMEQASSQVLEASKAQRNNIEEISRSAAESVKTAADSLKKDSLGITKSVSDNMQKLMEDNNTALKGSVKNLQQSLDDNLTESLTTFGQAMGQVSRRFVDDYTPLADKRLMSR